ncbi:aspartic peptidase domain-containing protein [Cytidiella melzeri]|nr:aspartic peptidase domain-containing protein [Cytidiella melzeri]
MHLASGLCNIGTPLKGRDSDPLSHCLKSEKLGTRHSIFLAGITDRCPSAGPISCVFSSDSRHLHFPLPFHLLVMNLSRSLACVLACAMLVSAWSVRSRRDDSVFVPDRVDIPLLYDSMGRYTTSVTMNPGSSQQQFNFTLTTSTALTYVAGSSCSGCSGAALYNRAQSTDAQSLSSSATSVPLFGLAKSASFVKEDCHFKMQDGSPWDYPNQTIVVVNEPDDSPAGHASNAQVGIGLSGIIGLGTAKQTSPSTNHSVYTPQFSDSPFGQWLAQNPTALNVSFGMALNQPRNMVRSNNTSNVAMPSEDSADAGILHLLQPDHTAYDSSKLVWKTVDLSANPQLPVSSNATSGADWFVNLDGWVMTSENNHLSNTESFIATVDPMYSDMYIPANQAKLIHDAVPGSQLRADLSSLGTLSQAWTVPCNSSYSFGLLVGTETFVVEASALIIKLVDGTCVSGIEGWVSASQTQYLLGARFLSTIYLIFQVMPDGPNSIGFAPRSVTRKNHVPAIVGGTIGGVALVAIIGFAVFFVVYSTRAKAHRIAAATFDNKEDLSKPVANGTVQLFNLQTPTTVQLPSAPYTPTTPGMTSPSTSVGFFTEHSAILARGTEDEHHADSLEVAPPSYEASEGVRSPASPVAPPLGKSTPSMTSLSTEHGVQQLQSTMSPIGEDSATYSGSGSNTVYEE